MNRRKLLAGTGCVVVVVPLVGVITPAIVEQASPIPQIRLPNIADMYVREIRASFTAGDSICGINIFGYVLRTDDLSVIKKSPQSSRPSAR
tara:strand:+ start:340 stop:612 length:273 start_codon:yes stop_codon:yes gene_type:complete